MKNKLASLGLSIIATLFIVGCGTSSQVPPDLDKILDITSNTLLEFQDNEAELKEEEAMKAFVAQLEQNLNSSNPVVHQGTIGIQLKEDGSLLGYDNPNNNEIKDSGESELFTIEIDSEKNRLIATDISGTSRDHHFSGTGLLAGLLIGHLLSRQRAAGVNPKSLANKTVTPKSSYQNARSRAGSGSHSRGK